jgi:hypothetical protein
MSNKRVATLQDFDGKNRMIGLKRWEQEVL